MILLCLVFSFCYTDYLSDDRFHLQSEYGRKEKIGCRACDLKGTIDHVRRVNRKNALYLPRLTRPILNTPLNPIHNIKYPLNRCDKRLSRSYRKPNKLCRKYESKTPRGLYYGNSAIINKTDFPASKNTTYKHAFDENIAVLYSIVQEGLKELAQEENLQILNMLRKYSTGCDSNTKDIETYVTEQVNLKHNIVMETIREKISDTKVSEHEEGYISKIDELINPEKITAFIIAVDEEFACNVLKILEDNCCSESIISEFLCIEREKKNDTEIFLDFINQAYSHLLNGLRENYKAPNHDSKLSKSIN